MEQPCSLLFSSLLFSCEDIKEQNEVYENEISSPTSLPLAASSVEFLAFTESSRENSLLIAECNCSYKIIDVDLPPLAGTNPRNFVEIQAFEDCDVNCDQFSTGFSSDGLCYDVIDFYGCRQEWDDVLEDYQPFNCLIESFSGFNEFVFSSFQGTEGGCSGIDASGSPRITISIRCQKQDSPSCGGTDTNVLIIDAYNYEEFGYFITGGECGCVPHFLKFENPENPSEGT